MTPRPFATSTRTVRRTAIGASGLILAVLLIAGAYGCVYLSEVIGLGPRPPTVSLTTVELTHLSSGSVELRLVLDVHNPNDFKINLSRVDYQATIRDRKIADGRMTGPIEMAASGVTPVKVPLKLDTAALLYVLKDYVRDPKGVVVRLKGEVEIKTSFGTWVIPFEQEKTVIQALS